MAGVVDTREGFGITTWGQRNGKQVWRVTWRERPGMVADVTGPHDTMEAAMKAYHVLERLPWREREVEVDDAS